MMSLKVIFCMTAVLMILSCRAKQNGATRKPDRDTTMTKTVPPDSIGRIDTIPDTTRNRQ